MQSQIDLVENTLMMNLPRMHRMEKLISDITKRVDNLDTNMNMVVKRSRLQEEPHESTDGQPTADLAASAPLFTELAPTTLPGPSLPLKDQPQIGAGERYGSGAVGKEKDPFDPTFILDPIRGDVVDRWGQSLLNTPVATPRRGRSAERSALPNVDAEPVWGGSNTLPSRRGSRIWKSNYLACKL